MCNDCPNFRCIHFSAEESTAITTLYDILDGHCPSVRADIEINSNERNLRRTEYVRVNDRKMKITPEVALKYENLLTLSWVVSKMPAVAQI